MSKTHLDEIAIDELKEFVQEALEGYGEPDTKDKLFSEADAIADVLTQLLKKKKLLVDNTRQSFVDVLISACYLHNLFYDPKDWTSIFLARKKLTLLAEKYGLNKSIQDALFQTIESQLGEDTPVPNCKPIANSPTELFSYAVWFVKEYVSR